MAYPDHDQSDAEKEFFGTLIHDLRSTAGFKIVVRLNAKQLVGKQIVQSSLIAMDNCDYLIAFVDRHSTTVGLRLGYAIKVVPILCLAHVDASVTRDIEGYAALMPLEFERYVDERDALRKILAFIERSEHVSNNVSLS